MFKSIVLVSAITLLLFSLLISTPSSNALPEFPKNLLEYLGEAKRHVFKFVVSVNASLGGNNGISARSGGDNDEVKRSDNDVEGGGKFLNSWWNWWCDRNDDDFDEEVIRLHNWGGNFMFSTQNIQYPRTTAEVQRIVRRANKKLRVLGSRHSYSKIADSADTILATLGINQILGFNQRVPSVLVQAGISYTDLAPALYANGYGLPNIQALAEVTVGGAAQTGSHGSGIKHQNVATHVRSIELVLANGTVANFTSKNPELKALALGLGAFGVITQIELKLVPAYNITQYVFSNMPTKNLYANFDAIQQMGYSVNLVTLMTNTSVWNQITINAKSGSEQDEELSQLTSLFDAPRSFDPSSPYIVEINKEQPWYMGLLNFRVGLSGADGNEIQSEYFIPYSKAVEAMKALEPLTPTILPYLSAQVVRTIAADDLWMSGHYGKRGDKKVAFHFTWQNNVPALNTILPQIEAVLAPFGASPHFGKLFTMNPKQFLRKSIFPKLDDFKKLADQLDPKKKFRNKFLEDNIFADVN